MAAGAVLILHAQNLRPAAPYSVVTSEGRTPIAAVVSGDQDLLRLDDLAAVFQLSVREDRTGNALTVSRASSTIVLSLDQGLASIAGRLVSLPSPPARDGVRWVVPPEFVARALALILDKRVEVRRPSRLIVVGDVRVPRVTVRQEPAGSATRVTFDVSPRANYSVAQDGRRLLVRFDADALDASPATGAGTGLVESITSSEPATVVLQLAAGFGSFRSATVPIDAASSRIVVDLMPSGAPSPPPSPVQLPPVPAPPPSDPSPTFAQPAGPAIRTVVIDPGHGGDEQGARGANGALEKDITLDVSRRLKATIEGRLGIRVILTRDDDRLVPLDERAAIANNNKADVFVSLHANASPSREAKGAEVFYLSLDGYGEEARKMAENPDVKRLPVVGVGSRDIELILWELAQARHLAESGVLAGLVEEELRRRVEMSPRSIQQAPFRVLVGANMPAVLVEMAFISNPDQESQLVSDGFKTRVVQALYDAIVRYRARIESPPGR